MTMGGLTKVVKCWTTDKPKDGFFVCMLSALGAILLNLYKPSRTMKNVYPSGSSV